MFSNLFILLCSSAILAIGLSVISIYVFNRIKKTKVIRSSQTMFWLSLFSLIGFIAILCIALPKYNFQKGVDLFSKAESRSKTLNPDFINVSSDEEICIYILQRAYFYKELFLTHPITILSLELHDKESTRDFLESMYVDIMRPLYIREEARQKIIKWIDSLNEQANKMNRTAYKFPQRNININEAETTIQEVLNELAASNYKFDEETVKKVTYLALHYKYQDEFPNDTEKNKDLAKATILFYDLLLSQGHSKAANAMRYLSLRSHIT